MRFSLPVLAFAATTLAWDGWSTNATDMVVGMNVGSYFVPETWMMESYFGCYAKDAIDPWSLGEYSNVSEFMINHLDNYIREIDFKEAAAKGVNMLRIPVAWWMFLETEGDEPYWDDSIQRTYYLPRLLQWAYTYGMEVLIDIHALPGSQNSDAHSGLTDATVQFYNSTNLIRGNETVDAIIEWIQGLNDTLQSTIALIELANEPSITATGDFAALCGYYQANQAKIATALPNVWTMIGDAWLGVQSWGNVFDTSQKVVLDLHWWLMFEDPPPTLLDLEDAYCSLSGPSDTNAWENPVLIGEFSANQNNYSLYDDLSTPLEQIEFFQEYYSTQLWAAQGSAGRLTQYRGAFMWSMICTGCDNVWQPYYVTGGWDTFDVVAPNWCNKTETSTYTASVVATPTHSSNSCGVYYDEDETSTTATSTSSSSSSTSTKKSAASDSRSYSPIFLGMMLLATTFYAS